MRPAGTGAGAYRRTAKAAIQLFLCGCAAAAAVPAAAASAAAQCPDGTPPPCTRGRAATPAAAANTVAVLYFENATRDTGDAYLADGLTEEIITRLAGIERLTVRSRYVVRRYRGSGLDDPGAVGRALGVTYLVSGSIRRSGGRLRVSAELIRAAGGTQVWGEQFDQSEGDVFAIQEAVAQQVATGIVGRLLPAERRTVAARTTRDPAAYDHFLRGNFHLARREPATLLRAIQEYEAAVQADPQFTEALARIAYSYAVALDNEYDVGLPRDTLIRRGVTMAERAVRLDSLSSDAWLARAYLRIAQYPLTLEGVRDRYERALALNPRSAEAHHQFAAYLGYMGDTAASARENRRALELEPGRAITWYQLSADALLLGQPAEGLRLADSALAADPTFVVAHISRVFCLVALGDTAAARTATQALLRSTSSLQTAGLFFDAFLTAAALGDTTSLRRFREAVLAIRVPATAPGTQVFAGYAALFLARLGDREGALQVLVSARPRGARLHSLMRFPWMDPIRDDPRFVALWNETRPPGAAW